MEYRSPVCKARICRKSPLMFQHPSFILARRNNRHHFRVSSRVMPMPPGYIKVFGFAPTWCTKECLTRKCRAFFCCSILKKARSGAASEILEQGGGTQCRKERHSAAFLSPRALYFLRTVCYGITVHGLPTIFMAIPHNSKCRYGERGATAAKPKAQIILDAAKVSAASGGNSEPKQGQRSQSARGFCPRSTMRVPQPDIIEHFGNADAVPQPPERCLSR